MGLFHKDSETFGLLERLSEIQQKLSAQEPGAQLNSLPHKAPSLQRYPTPAAGTHRLPEPRAHAGTAAGTRMHCCGHTRARPRVPPWRDVEPTRGRHPHWGLRGGRTRWSVGHRAGGRRKTRSPMAPRLYRSPKSLSELRFPVRNQSPGRPHGPGDAASPAGTPRVGTGRFELKAGTRALPIAVEFSFFFTNTTSTATLRH